MNEFDGDFERVVAPGNSDNSENERDEIDRLSRLVDSRIDETDAEREQRMFVIRTRQLQTERLRIQKATQPGSVVWIGNDSGNDPFERSAKTSYDLRVRLPAYQTADKLRDAVGALCDAVTSGNVDLFGAIASSARPAVWAIAVGILVGAPTAHPFHAEWYKTAWNSKGFTGVVQVAFMLTALMTDSDDSNGLVEFARTSASRGVLVAVYDMLSEINEITHNITEQAVTHLINAIKDANGRQSPRASITPLCSMTYTMKLFMHPRRPDGVSEPDWESLMSHIYTTANIGRVSEWTQLALYPSTFYGIADKEIVHMDIFDRVTSCDLLLMILSPIDGGVLGFSCANYTSGAADSSFTVTVTCFLLENDHMRESETNTQRVFETESQKHDGSLFNIWKTANTFKIEDCKDAFLRGWCEVAASRLVPAFFLVPDLPGKPLGSPYVTVESSLTLDHLASDRVVPVEEQYARTVKYAAPWGNQYTAYKFWRFLVGAEMRDRAAVYAMRADDNETTRPEFKRLFAWSKYPIANMGNALFVASSSDTYLKWLGELPEDLPDRRRLLDQLPSINVATRTRGETNTLASSSTVFTPVLPRFSVLFELVTLHPSDKVIPLLPDIVNDMMTRTSYYKLRARLATHLRPGSGFGPNLIASGIGKIDHEALLFDVADILAEEFADDLATMDVVVLNGDKRNMKTLVEAFRTADLVAMVVVYPDGGTRTKFGNYAKAKSIMDFQQDVKNGIVAEARDDARILLKAGLQLSPLGEVDANIDALLQHMYSHGSKTGTVVLTKATAQLSGLLTTVFGGASTPMIERIPMGQLPPEISDMSAEMSIDVDDTRVDCDDEDAATQESWFVYDISTCGIVFAFLASDLEAFMDLVDVRTKRTENWVKEVFGFIRHAFTGTPAPVTEWVAAVWGLFDIEKWAFLTHSQMACLGFLDVCAVGIPSFAYNPVGMSRMASFDVGMKTLLAIFTCVTEPRLEDNGIHAAIEEDLVTVLRDNADLVKFLLIGAEGSFTKVHAIQFGPVPSLRGMLSIPLKKRQSIDNRPKLATSLMTSTFVSLDKFRQPTISESTRVEDVELMEIDPLPQTSTSPVNGDVRTFDHVPEPTPGVLPPSNRLGPVVFPNAITYLLRTVSLYATGVKSSDMKTCIGGVMLTVKRELYHSKSGTPVDWHVAISDAFATKILRGLKEDLPTAYVARRIFGKETTVEIHRLIHILWVELLLVFNEAVLNANHTHRMAWLLFYCRRFHEAIHMHVTKPAATALEIINRILYPLDVAHHTYADPVAYMVVAEQGNAMFYINRTPSATRALHSYLTGEISDADSGTRSMVDLVIAGAGLGVHMERDTGFFTQPWPLLALLFVKQDEREKHAVAINSSVEILVDAIEGRTLRSVTPAYIHYIRGTQFVRAGLFSSDVVDENTRVSLFVTPSTTTLSETSVPMYASIIDMLLADAEERFLTSDQREQLIAYLREKKTSEWAHDVDEFPGSVNTWFTTLDEVVRWSLNQTTLSVHTDRILLDNQCPPVVACYMIGSDTRSNSMNQITDDQRLQLVVHGPPVAWFKQFLESVSDNVNNDQIAKTMLVIMERPWQAIHVMLNKQNLKGSVFDSKMHHDRLKPKTVAPVTAWISKLECKANFLPWLQVEGTEFPKTKELLMQVARETYLPAFEMAVELATVGIIGTPSTNSLLRQIDTCGIQRNTPTDPAFLTPGQRNHVTVVNVILWLRYYVRESLQFLELADDECYANLFAMFKQTFKRVQGDNNHLEIEIGDINEAIPLSAMQL